MANNHNNQSAQGLSAAAKLAQKITIIPVDLKVCFLNRKVQKIKMNYITLLFQKVIIKYTRSKYNQKVYQEINIFFANQHLIKKVPCRTTLKKYRFNNLTLKV